ncbi:hypothetical protein ACHAXT_007532 [Thalassiosira profunda]
MTTMAASLTETAPAAVPPPPGLPSSPVGKRPLPVHGAPLLGSLSMGAGLLRRAASNDDGLGGGRGRIRTRTEGDQFLALNSSAAASPWGGTFDSVFRASDEARQGPNEPQHRLRSHTLDPMLGGDDDDSIVLGVNGRDAGRDRMDLFRPRQNTYSPVVGTPTRASGRGGPDWSPRHATADSPHKDGDAIWIPAIRPSLSCPTSVFESPLFPSRTGTSLELGSGNNNSGGSINGGMGSPSPGRGPTVALGGTGAPTRLLSELYPLQKIVSASQDQLSPTFATAADGDRRAGRENPLRDRDEASLSSTEEPLLEDDEDGPSIHGDGEGLANVDVSVIECEADEPSFRQIVPNPHLEGDLSGSGSELHAAAPQQQPRPATTTMENPSEIRNLSNAFELLGRGMGSLATAQGLDQKLEGMPQALDANVLSAETASDGTDKPSPTSVLGLESTATSSTATSNSAGASALRLENGLTVASIAMPHFRLHESLRGNLSQGLVDRASFYSVVRDINKEAGDAAAADPQGGAYNDGPVHGAGAGAGSGPPSQPQPPSAPLPPPPSATKPPPVVAEDGKVHLHPDPREEARSVLVVACTLPEAAVGGGNNPNEGPSDDPRASAALLGPAPLGPALLDEEWWLLSAVAGRDPAEAEANKSSALLPTFYEAMGEKDASAAHAPLAETTSGSRTQLWKPGRSWWEAKSGKNPWVEPVVHNNRWRYLWPLIHYHKFIAKCIKKLKRNGIDVKTSTSSVSLFLRQEVCNVSDHLAFMSKYDSEEWTSALSHFDGWTDHDPTVEETLRALVASQRLVGASSAAATDLRSSLLRSQIDDKILKAMQAAREEAGRDAYEYKDVPAPRPAPRGKADPSNRERPPSSQQPQQPKEQHLRSAVDHGKKKTIDDASWSSSGYHRPGQYPPHSVYRQPSLGSAPSSLGYGDTDSLGSNFYPPPPHPPHHQYHGYPGQYPAHPPPHPGYYHHGPVPYPGQYGHPDQYYNGGYYPSADHSHSVDGSYHDGSFHHSFDTSMHSHHTHDPHYLPPSMMQTPSRYNGSGYPPASPYWEHLHISQLPGIAASPSIHVTPSKPPRGDGRPNRSYRKRQPPQQPRGPYGSNGGAAIDGKAKSLLMFPKHTNSPASRFVMSPQDKSNHPYYAKGAQSAAAGATPGKEGSAAQPPTATLNHSAGPEESFVLPTIGDCSADGPAARGAAQAAAHTSLHSNTSVDLMPPRVRKVHTRPPRREKLSEVSESP